MKHSQMDEITERAIEKILEGTRSVLAVELGLLADELMDAFVDRLREVAQGLGVKVTEEKPKKKPARKKKPKRRSKKKPKASGNKNQAEKVVDFLARKKRASKAEIMKAASISTDDLFYTVTSSARKKVKPQGLGIVLHDDGKYYLEPAK